MYLINSVANYLPKIVLITFAVSLEIGIEWYDWGEKGPIFKGKKGWQHCLLHITYCIFSVFKDYYYRLANLILSPFSLRCTFEHDSYGSARQFERRTLESY